MKYRYVFSRDDAKNKLIIKEFTRGVDEHLSMMGSREVDGAAIEKALGEDEMALVNILRDHGMYPPENVALNMAKLVAELYGPAREEISEGHVDEIDIAVPEAPPVVEEPADADDEDIDSDLPDEDILESDDLELETTESDRPAEEEDDTLEPKPEEKPEEKPEN